MDKDLIYAHELREIIESAMDKSKVLNVMLYLMDWKLIFQLDYVDTAGRKFRYVFPSSVLSVDDLPRLSDLRLVSSDRVILSLGEALIYNVIRMGGKQIWGVYKARVSNGGWGIKFLKNKLLSWGFLPKSWAKHYKSSSLRIRATLILPMDIKRFIEFYRYLPSPKGVSKELFSKIMSYLRESREKVYPILVAPSPPVKLGGEGLFRYLAYNTRFNNLDPYIGGYKTRDAIFVTSPDLYLSDREVSESVAVDMEPLIGSYMDIKDGSFICNLMI